jgi:hypothetical protein
MPRALTRNSAEETGLADSKSLERYREIVAILDQMDRSAAALSALVGDRTRYWVQQPLADIGGRLAQVRDAVEDDLYECHGRLGFESERGPEASAESNRPLPRVQRGKLTAEQTQAIRESREPRKALAARYGISQSRVYEIRSGRVRVRGRWSGL